MRYETLFEKDFSKWKSQLINCINDSIKDAGNCKIEFIINNDTRIENEERKILKHYDTIILVKGGYPEC